MPKKMLFIYNPHAGKAQIRSNLLDIIDTFTVSGYEVTAYPTQGEGDAARAVLERAGDFELVVCSGGDGTLDEVVSGMMQREERIPIGYVPAGSTNDFASSLRIPSNMKKAADIVVNGTVRAFDIGSFNGRTFVYVAAFGMPAEVSYETTQDMKNLLGHAAYILEGAIHIADIEPYRIQVEYDDGKIDEPLIFGMISNSLSVGGIKFFRHREVFLDDGLFEVILVRAPRTLADLHAISMAMSQGGDHENVFIFKASWLKISSKEPVPWTLDGEKGGVLKNVELSNLRRGLKMIVPRDEVLPVR
ncbi:MAG: YegS/Rv2252/BmrU family lipid kinase [Lachnospiraceae bacterium]|nr:YegS/Rv2252/BmrU family lipid kinase [Lachnospiraceae bacterium]